MKFFVLFGVIFSFLLGPNAMANLSLRLELQNRLRDQIASQIEPVDPMAQVLVQVELKKVTTTLPGTSLTVLGLPTSGLEKSLDANDLSSVKVNIYTQLDPFPDFVKKSLETTLTDEGLKAELTYHRLDPELLKMIESNQTLRVLKADMSSFFSRFLWFFGFFIVVVLSGALLHGSRTRKFYDKEFGRLVSAIESQAEGGMGSRSPVIDVPSASAPMETEASLSDDSAKNLDVSSLLSVFSDCYWCQEDAYANWLWLNCSADQRKQVVQKWPQLEAYVRQVSRLSPVNLGYHLDPSYLQPLQLENVSQEDLAAFVSKNPQVWKRLSPMRQLHLPFALSERVRISQAPPEKEGAKLPTLPAASKNWRIFPPRLELKELSMEDELAIWENPDIVPTQLRSNVPSLVWLALLDRQQQEGLLARYQAQELAQAWIGPETVLDSIQTSIPEKKRKLMESYLDRLQSSRRSASYLSITSQAALLLASQESKDLEGQTDEVAA